MQNYYAEGGIPTLESRSDKVLTPPAEPLCLNCSDLDLRLLSTAHDPRAGLVSSKGSPKERSFVSRKSDSSTHWIWDCNDTLDCILCDFMTHCHFLVEGIKVPVGPCSILERTWKPKLEIEEPGGAYATLRISDYTSSFKWSSLYPPGCYLDIAAGTPPSGLTPRVSLIEPFFSSLNSATALMEKCRAEHRLCMIPMRGSNRKLTRLQVIDCISRQVIPAPTSCQFVALSYVWGTSLKPSRLDGAVKLPQTIEDAILVTTALGLQYLWVDSICITQNDGADFLHQLHQMDLVYAEAELTIIATGCNSSTGLFGITRERSLLHKRVYINGFTITTFFDQTWSFVKRSPWATRGWTFQESLLSKRRMFFAEDQVLWDCTQDWGCETLTCSKSQLPRPIDDYENILGVLRLPLWKSTVFSPPECGSIYQLIGMYSALQLTYPEDILDAFTGVFRQFNELDSSFKHHWGVPIMASNPVSMKIFLLGLEWEQIDRYFTERLERRTGFPSWSWTGWHTRLMYFGWPELYRTYNLVPGTDLAIELNDKARLPWSDFLKSITSMSLDSSALTPYIFLRGWSTTITIMYYERSNPVAKIWPCVASIGRPHSAQFFNFSPTANVEDFEHCSKDTNGLPLVQGILLGRMERKVTNEWQDFYSLLLVARKEDYWLRVGMLRLNGSFRTLGNKHGFEDMKFTQEWLVKGVEFSNQEFRLG